MPRRPHPAHAQPEQAQTEQARTGLTLPAQLDAAAALALQDALLGRRGTPLDIHAQAVTRIGTPAMAVLLAAAADWARDGLPLRLLQPSPAVRHAAATLALPHGAFPLSAEEALP